MKMESKKWKKKRKEKAKKKGGCITNKRKSWINKYESKGEKKYMKKLI